MIIVKLKSISVCNSYRVLWCRVHRFSVGERKREIWVKSCMSIIFTAIDVALIWVLLISLPTTGTSPSFQSSPNMHYRIGSYAFNSPLRTSRWFVFIRYGVMFCSAPNLLINWWFFFEDFKKKAIILENFWPNTSLINGFPTGQKRSDFSCVSAFSYLAHNFLCSIYVRIIWITELTYINVSSRFNCDDFKKIPIVARYLGK